MHSWSYIECDVPEELTLREWAASRRERQTRDRLRNVWPVALRIRLRSRSGDRA